MTTTPGLAKQSREAAAQLQHIANRAQHIDTETLQNVVIELTQLLQNAFELIEQLEAEREKPGQ